MGSYTAVKKFTSDFDGDNIVYTLKSPDVQLMKRVTPFLIRGSSAGKIGLMESVEMMEALSSDIVASTVSFAGCKDSEGNELTIEKVCGEIYFLSLVSEMIANLFSMGGISKDTEKKLDSIPSTDSITHLGEPEGRIVQLAQEPLADTTPISPSATTGQEEVLPELNGRMESHT